MAAEAPGPLLAACLWVLAVSALAMLPIRLQILPGLLLLALAPALLWWLGSVFGPVAVALGVLTVLSLFRRPLAALVRRAVLSVGGGR